MSGGSGADRILAARIGEEHAADRLMRSQKLQQGSIYLYGQPAPTAGQVAAVLHALADHGLQAHMNSETVLALGEDRAHLGGTWRQDTAHGRFFQMMGKWLEGPDDDTSAAVTPAASDPHAGTDDASEGAGRGTDGPAELDWHSGPVETREAGRTAHSKRDERQR